VRCGNSIPQDTRFCPNCGSDLSSIAQTKAEVPAGLVARLRAVTLGEYEILGELGRGGMATVFLAHEIALDRKVAIKVLNRTFVPDSDLVNRFRREAVTAASLNHPNIVTIHNVRAVEQLYYIVMKYIEGRTLDALIGEHGPLPVDVVRALLFQVGSALEYAHGRGVIHRDIKPSNIILSPEGDAVVMDFGIAKAIESESPDITLAGGLVGTPRYMSPEQCVGDSLTPRSDQYSLGVVLYELLTGQPPFFIGTSLDLMWAHMSTEATPIRRLRPEVPARLADAVLRMLSKRPEDRWPDLSSVLLACEATPLGPNDPLRREIARLVAGGEGARARSERLEVPEGARPVGIGARQPNRGGFFDWLRSLFFRSAGVPTLPSPPPATPTFPSRERAPVQPHAPTPVVDASTAVFAPEDWLPPEHHAAASTGPEPDHTEVFSGTEEAGEPALPVALSITSAPDPGRIGTRARCTQFPFTVGRAESSHLSFPDDLALSRTHVEISRDEGGFLVRDLSTNGVYVNGRHLKGKAEPLYFGATIVLSKATSLTFIADIPLLPNLTGQVLADRFRLGEQLHQSIKANTYLAEDLRIPRSLVVKVFSPALMGLPRYREEFQRQARLAAKLQHPHISKVIDFGEATVSLGGQRRQFSYLCTEFMEGGNLAGRIETQPLPSLEAITIWIQRLAGALQYAHRYGVIHGDLKPSCIVFDSEETPYLTDFALARAHESETRSVVGTPAYLAPEQWNGEPPTEATDQYSLAVLTYQTVTGTRPHERQDDPEVRSRNFRRGPEPAHEAAVRIGREELPHRVSAVIAKAMSLTPAERYPSVQAFGAAFAEAVAQEDEGDLPPRVFLSYQRQASAGWANLFANALAEKNGWSVFIDTQSRDGAPQIPERLRQEITACDVFVCLLAPGTLTSNWVRQEIAIAFQCKKPMVPVFHEDFRPKDEAVASEPSVEALLNFAAVHLLDRRNIHIEHTIKELGDQIRRLV
jgi:serine/threonine protein kinase/pSer/pThr/pTyr-binding forkhead associated (FHA) protein